MAKRPSVTKAVIPAAGAGTRFLPATKAEPKEMLPVVDRPAIQYVAEEAVRAGLHDILIITGRGKQSIEDHFDRNVELEQLLLERGKDDLLAEVREAEMPHIHYVRQGEPLGLGHAVLMAREHVGDQPFAVLLGDEFWLDGDDLLPTMIDTYLERRASVVAVQEFPGDEIKRYGAVAHEPVAERLVQIHGVVEKPVPEEAPSNLGIVGRYVFTPEIFDALDDVKPGVGGEIQLTDAIAILLDDQPVYGLTYKTGRRDTGTVIDWLETTVELAVERDDLGPDLMRFLADLVARPGIGGTAKPSPPGVGGRG